MQPSPNLNDLLEQIQNLSVLYNSQASPNNKIQIEKIDDPLKNMMNNRDPVRIRSTSPVLRRELEPIQEEIKESDKKFNPLL